MLSLPGMAARVVALLAGLGLIFAGSIRGTDDWFPFGPFLMYAGINSPNGVANSARLEAVTATGEVIGVRDGATGLRRSELEGQLSRISASPALLRAVAQAHANRRPEEPAYVEVRAINRVFQLHNGKVVGYTDHTLASWRRP